jgi:Fe-S cluster biogenesis protein NfuA
VLILSTLNPFLYIFFKNSIDLKVGACTMRTSSTRQAQQGINAKLKRQVVLLDTVSKVSKNFQKRLNKSLDKK